MYPSIVSYPTPAIKAKLSFSGSVRNQCRVGPEKFARAAAVAGQLRIIIGLRTANLQFPPHIIDPLGLLSSKNHLFLN